MIRKEIQEIEDKLRIISPGTWEFNLDTLTHSTGAANTSQLITDYKFMAESPEFVRKLLVEVESQQRDIEYWKIQAQRALSEVRSTKLDTIKGSIRLLRTIYLPTRAARDVLNQAKKLLQEFKTKDLSEMIDQQDDVLVFDIEPPQIP